MSLTDSSLPDLLTSVGIEPNDNLICDSAKMNYITDLRHLNFKALKARKGPDSVNLGIEIVQGFIIYVTNTSENIWNEEMGYEWELDRYNKPTDKPIKKDDHSMDAIRYCIHWLYYYFGLQAKKRISA